MHLSAPTTENEPLLCSCLARLRRGRHCCMSRASTPLLTAAQRCTALWAQGRRRQYWSASCWSGRGACGAARLAPHSRGRPLLTRPPQWQARPLPTRTHSTGSPHRFTTRQQRRGERKGAEQSGRRRQGGAAGAPPHKQRRRPCMPTGAGTLTAWHGTARARRARGCDTTGPQAPVICVKLALAMGGGFPAKPGRPHPGVMGHSQPSLLAPKTTHTRKGTDTPGALQGMSEKGGGGARSTHTLAALHSVLLAPLLGKSRLSSREGRRGAGRRQLPATTAAAAAARRCRCGLQLLPPPRARAPAAHARALMPRGLLSCSAQPRARAPRACRKHITLFGLCRTAVVQTLAQLKSMGRAPKRRARPPSLRSQQAAGGAAAAPPCWGPGCCWAAARPPRPPPSNPSAFTSGPRSPCQPRCCCCCRRRRRPSRAGGRAARARGRG